MFSLWVYSNLTTEKNRKGRVKFVYFYGNGERKNRIEKYYRAPTPTIFIVFGICFFSGKKKKKFHTVHPTDQIVDFLFSVLPWARENSRIQWGKME